MIFNARSNRGLTKKWFGRMKRNSIGLSLYLAFSATLPASTPQESLDQVYETTGTATEIAKRAQVCMVKHLHNESVQLSSGLKSAGKSEGGQTLALADIEGGTLVATHRVSFSSWGMGQVAQSVLTVNTKDGRFKMETTDIKAAQLNTGAIANSGFVEYRESAPAFKAAVKAIGDVQKKLVECIKNTSANNW